MHKQRCGRTHEGARTVARLLDRRSSSRAWRTRSGQHIHVGNSVRELQQMQHVRRQRSLPWGCPEVGTPCTRLQSNSIAPSNAQRRFVSSRLRCAPMLHRTTRWGLSGWAPAECATRPTCEAVCDTRDSAACSHALRDDATSICHERGSGRAANNRGAQTRTLCAHRRAACAATHMCLRAHTAPQAQRARDASHPAIWSALASMRATTAPTLPLSPPPQPSRAENGGGGGRGAAAHVLQLIARAHT